MPRKPNEEKLKNIYSTIQQHPGKRAGFIAKLLRLHRSEVTRTLPALEERGYTLSEDQKGRLFPFKSQ